MTASRSDKGAVQNENTILSGQEQTASITTRESTRTEPTPSKTTTSRVPAEELFLGDSNKVSKYSRQLAVTRCLNSISGGSKRPWKAYPGHSKLVTLDMDMNGTRESHQYHSTTRSNSEIKDWLDWRIQPDSDSFNASGTSKKKKFKQASLKLLLVTLTGGETTSSTAGEDSKVLQTVFDEWSFPTAALSVILDRVATCMNLYVATKPTSKGGKKLEKQVTRVCFIGMRQWSMVWHSDPFDRQLKSRGVIMCLDKTWASSVPGVVLQYFKSMWMFLDYRGILPLVACMANLRYVSSALAEDDKEAFQREYELRSWLKDGFTTENKDLGYTSAQVSWLSSRVSRHRDRLMVTNRVLGILKETLDIYELLAKEDSFEILRDCICNLADMKEHLRAHARQLEAQANVQLAALFNLITQKDSATAMIIARTSQSIATDSRRDQKISVDIANSSRAIAFNTLRDSASMKAIAHVTMVFLPGTFLASVFAMPFFSSQKGTNLFVNSKIWIYFAFTVPLTIATIVCAWVWYHFSARSHRPLHKVDPEERPLRFIGGEKTGAHSRANVKQVQNVLPSPAEKSIEPRSYARDGDKLDDSSQLEVEFEQVEYDEKNYEHWDPMTREFAPSIFAPSSFAFTEDSNSPTSSDSDSEDIEPTFEKPLKNPQRSNYTSENRERVKQEGSSESNFEGSYRSRRRPSSPVDIRRSSTMPGLSRSETTRTGRSPAPEVPKSPGRGSNLKYGETPDSGRGRNTKNDYGAAGRPRSGSGASGGSGHSHRGYSY